MKFPVLTVHGILSTIALTASTANAQTTFGRIVGDVRDSSGSSMVGVEFTVTNEGSRETYKHLTTEVGSYAFNTLIPGTYTDIGGAEGISASTRAGDCASSQSNGPLRSDDGSWLGNRIGQRNASAPVLATDSADVGQVVTQRQIVELPLNGRNYMQLTALTNGVILAGTTESGGPNFLSEGGRPTQNSFLVDGVESRIQREGGYGLNLSVEAIDEFKVMQNSFSAEYGRGTTIVNAAIRSGTNAYHGSVFEFLRNEKLDARNAFDLTSTKLPPLRFNQFGAAVGGPIIAGQAFLLRQLRGPTRSTGIYRVWQRAHARHAFGQPRRHANGQ